MWENLIGHAVALRRLGSLKLQNWVELVVNGLTLRYNLLCGPQEAKEKKDG